MRKPPAGRGARLALAGWLALLVGTPLLGQEPPPPGAGVPPGMIVPDPAAFDASVPFVDPEMEATVRKLASQLRCPTCQALSIEDSPSELSQQMKEVIRDRLREGMTPEEVRQHFVAAYGEWILLSPTPAGFNLLVYILPVVAVLVGLGLLFLGIRRWVAAGAGAGADTEPGPPAGTR